MDARSDLTLPCYCPVAAKNRFACVELLFGPGLLTDRVHTRFELKLPRYSSAAVNSRFTCTELLFGPGRLTNRAHARFELELPCYCSSAAAKYRLGCTATAVWPRASNRTIACPIWVETAPPPFCCCDISFFCTELLGLLLVLLTLGCFKSLWIVLNVTCLTL